MKRAAKHIGVVLLVFTLVNAPACWLGYGIDRDSLRVIQSAVAILHGHYQRSRSFGFPLHELAAAALYALGGLAAVNLGALLAALAAITLAARLAAARAFPVAVALAACPVVLVNASVAVDFCFGLAACLAVLLAADRRWPWVFSGAALAACLLRPDNVLPVGAVCLALLWRNWRLGLRFMALAVLAGVAAGVVYLGLNGGLGVLAGVSTSRPWGARLARAAVFGSAALGPGGALLAAYLPWRWRDWRAAPLPAVAAVLLWVMFLPRFAALPDQLDYLIVPVAFTILGGLVLVPARLVWPAVGLTALPLLVSLGVFVRAADGRLAVRPSLQPGVIWQEASARLVAMRLGSPEGLALVAAQLPQAARLGLRQDVFMPGYTNAHGDLVIGTAQLYRILPRNAGLGALATVPRGFYADIYACDGAFAPGSGWRGWEAPAAVALPPARCRLADVKTP